MKKKILSIAFVAAIAVAGALNMSQNENEVSLTDLALGNVEALARGEAEIDSGSYFIIFVSESYWICYPNGRYNC